MSDTPETDARIGVISNGSNIVDAGWARQLERERDEAREKYIMHVELKEWCGKCEMNWHPSLVESSVCIFCIQKETARERDEAREAIRNHVFMYQDCRVERDQLRKVADELYILATETDLTNWDATVTSYNQLPHVIERNAK